MRITVIIPVYNVEKYVKKCLNSIIHQTYKAYEIIVIDDGSTDNSFNICKDYVDKYENVQLIHRENKGISAARNAGLQIAKGEYITFVDSDDWLEPDAIETLVDVIVKKEADMSVILRTTNSNIEELPYVGSGEEALLHLLNIGSIEAWGKLYKKDIFKSIRYPEGNINEDLYMLPDIVSQCNKIAVSHIGKYNYRQRNDGIMGNELRAGSENICNCCFEGVKKAEKLSTTNEYRGDLQKWYYYHILWYFYNVYCNCDCKEGLRNISHFYRKTLAKCWKNTKIKISDKFRFSFIAACPGLVKKYNVFKYGEK